ncbi:phosphate ABC transporter permease PstA [bacterium]|nr:phosphate ABC transporter permease PstA [bacterium]
MSRRAKEAIIYAMMRGATYLIILVVGYIVFDIVWNGLPVIDWKFLSTRPTSGGAKGGIFPAIVGTFWLVAGAIAVALPFGMACAVYLTEYAKPGRFLNFVRLAITTLAGVPSIVFGLFGLGLFVLFFGFGQSILAGSLTLACLILPTIIVASEESLRAVPNSFRAASMALGATKWYTIRTNVLPYAMPGMMTGSILGLGRAAGETAPILFTVAAFFLPRLPKSALDQVMALPYHLYVTATQLPNPAEARHMQYGTAMVLLALVLGMNLIAILLRSYFSRKYRW